MLSCVHNIHSNERNYQPITNCRGGVNATMFNLNNTVLKRKTTYLVFILFIALFSTKCILVSAGITEAGTKAPTDQQEDYMLKQNEEEEDYIVNLVSNRTNTELKRTDWKQCLAYIQEHYNTLLKDESIDSAKVISYAQAYSFIKEDEKYPNSAINYKNILDTRSKSYSPSKATEYSDRYWDTFNPSYPNMSSYNGDCANFVSQVLKAGGKKMVGQDASNFSNWFCRTNSANELSKISSTWRGADAFGHYWRPNSKGYKTFDQSYFRSSDAFRAVYNYGKAGDAISFLNENGRPYHTAYISYKEDGKLKFASHTSAHKWKSLYNYINENGGAKMVRIYKM